MHTLLVIANQQKEIDARWGDQVAADLSEQDSVPGGNQEPPKQIVTKLTPTNAGARRLTAQSEKEQTPRASGVASKETAQLAKGEEALKKKGQSVKKLPERKRQLKTGSGKREKGSRWSVPHGPLKGAYACGR